MKFSPTILDALNHHASETPNKVVFAWVDIKCEEQDKMTFKQLEDQSNTVAARLIKLGCQKGDRVMIAYPFGLEFLAGMFGAMKIGVVPCSIYPPNPSQLKTDMPKFRRFAEDAGAKFALTTATFATAMTAASVLYKTGVKWIGTDKLSIKKTNPNKPKEYETFVGEPNEICFIQYTSGSTGRPKGVMISHQNLAENCRAGISLTDLDTSSVVALWVPQYHDMGLAGFMSCLYTGSYLVVASPLDFIAQPLLWSDMVETYKATHTAAPNFAYALLLKRLEQAKRSADWSCMKAAMFGAEPAQSHVVAAVAKTLSVKPECVFNNYGLAESVVLLTGGPARPDAEGVVCCGDVDSPTIKLRIVEDGKEVEDGQVGSIWAQSPRVAVGYFGQPELTISTFANALSGYEGTWLDTGDLGKIVDGQLYVTGRAKDVIIVNGKNYYPTDVESSIDAAFGDIIRPGRTAAFQYGEDSIGITVEARKGFDKLANDDLAIQVSNHASQFHGLFAVKVLVLKLDVTPKTTSGKLKRSEIKQTTVAGAWNDSSVMLQFQRVQAMIPLKKKKRASFLENTFSNQGIASSEFYLSVGTQCEIMRGSTCPSQFSAKYDNAITAVFGFEVDASKTWAENGLSSLKSAELRNKIEEEIHIVLPANFEQLYPTPEALSNFLEASKVKTFPKQEIYNHPDFLWKSSRSRLSKLQLGVLQTVASTLILLLIVVSIVPSYFLVSWLMDQCDSTKVGECNSLFFWILLPLSFPLYLFSFSLTVVFCKYAVIGTYFHSQVDLLSWGYLQWWFVDRVLEIWESFVGPFIVETKLIWVFYWLLGADLAWSAKIESFFREFDLVRVADNSVINHPLKCRKFSQSTETGPKLTFRPINVGKHCNISGMLCPGAKIGDGSMVEKFAVVEDGAQVPDGVLARGNPACQAGSFKYQESISFEESVLDAFKIVWIVVEAYHFFALSCLVHTMLQSILPIWRYATILHWFLLFPATSFLALVPSIALKWLLIGKRDAAEEYDGSLYRQATNWACDFHFRIASWSQTPFFGQTRFWHIILFLHGLDVDMESCISNPYRIFLPSKVDFVKIRKSFVATSTIDLNQQADSKMEIVDSSVGYNSNLHTGAKIIKSKIPPRSDVRNNITELNQAERPWKAGFLMDLILPEVLQLLLNVAIFSSLIPAYEIGAATMKSSSSIIVMFGLTAAIVLQLFVWILLTKAVEGLMLNLPSHAQQSFCAVYINHMWQFGVGNWLVFLLYGTPMFAYYARMMGATVEGDLWFFGNSLYEYAKLHFQGCTIVDDSHVSGHFIDGNGITIDDTYVTGVLHPGCYASAGSVVSGPEHGPWKLFLRKVDEVHVGFNDEGENIIKQESSSSVELLDV
ncbi:D-alanine--D-alanyl carrier protein ligase [Seminavis robusta]|uniref:D-alanine--D-alanyl carrier protein ligase n=1 Tax=Seminavis robusta TaxID=568900 RepID=A0A9N8DJU3_9STRA|nr:D-alanine--D-alanyl carrier protein ligase [Seminavis robusta]|eukprot:Sro193_g082580.1 D-alanine--D-alanyl carrier protein ligase (1368) ;mRNA; f:41204-45390